MANIFDAAKYILEQRGGMSVMKLQKLCYYSQTWSLVWDGSPLFDEDFRAWATGPVCPGLFRKTKGQFFANVGDETDGQGNLTKGQKETISLVLDHYGDKDAQWLSQLTRMEDPWIRAAEGVPPGAGSGSVITKESMTAYYGGLLKR